MAAPASWKPWILALLISLLQLVLLAMPDASGFVPGRWERFFPVVRHSACKATSQSAEFGFEIGPVLQEAHKAWGRLFEDHEEPAKLREEIGKQWEEIRKLREDLQLLGATTCHAGIVWRILSCSIYSFNCLLRTNRKAWTLYLPRAWMLCAYFFHLYLLDIHIRRFIMYIVST